jgi:hypothetical protein
MRKRPRPKFAQVLIWKYNASFAHRTLTAKCAATWPHFPRKVSNPALIPIFWNSRGYETAFQNHHLLFTITSQLCTSSAVIRQKKSNLFNFESLVLWLAENNPTSLTLWKPCYSLHALCLCLNLKYLQANFIPKTCTTKTHQAAEIGCTAKIGEFRLHHFGKRWNSAGLQGQSLEKNSQAKTNFTRSPTSISTPPARPSQFPTLQSLLTSPPYPLLQLWRTTRWREWTIPRFITSTGQLSSSHWYLGKANILNSYNHHGMCETCQVLWKSC